jgi:hypothetical protein
MTRGSRTTNRWRLVSKVFEKQTKLKPMTETETTIRTVDTSELADGPITVDCTYCENPDKFGLLPARELTIDTSHRDMRLDYGRRFSVRSLVHPEKNGTRLMVGIRCYNDTNAAERIAEDAEIPLEAVQPVA